MTVVTVEDTTEQAIQRALDHAGSSSIVVIPAGRFAIAGTLEVRGDDVLIVGAGAGDASLGQDAGVNATVLARTPHEADQGRPILHAAARKRVQISGIRLEGVSDPASSSKDVGVLLEDAEDFRVDHVYSEHMGFAGVRINGESRGVVDHSAFYAEYKSKIETDGYGVVVYGTDRLTGTPLGSADPTLRATFIEDSSFALCRHAAASNKAARYVFRHNQVSSGVVAHAVDAHGAEYGSKIGTEWIDVYENTIDQQHHTAPYYDNRAVRIRGGQGLVWNNAIRGYGVGVELTQETSERTGPVYVWGNSREPAKGKTTESTHEASEAVLAAPSGYAPHAYPHPIVASHCAPDAEHVRAGWAEICVRE